MRAMDEATIRWVYLYLLGKIKYGNAVLRITKKGDISTKCTAGFRSHPCNMCPVGRECLRFWEDLGDESRTKIFKELIRRKIIPYALYMKIEYE